MSRDKRHDEIYCPSCGEPIKKKAEICPNCGVSNPRKKSNGSIPKQNKNTKAGNQIPQNKIQTQSTVEKIESYLDSTDHNPNEHTTTVSKNWYYGVGVSIVFWIIGFALPTESSLAGAAILLGWVLMPLSIFYDRRWVKATTQWNPKMVLWLTLAIIPLINIPAGVVYLIRRHNTEQVSRPDSGKFSERETDPALVELRERYSRGELSDEEFEEKVEQIVGTENSETAKTHIRTSEKSEE